MLTWQLAVIILGGIILTLAIFLWQKKNKDDQEESKLTILICGINGKMGSYLAERLADKYHIIGLDPNKKSKNWDTFSYIADALEEIPDIMLDFVGAKGIDNLRYALQNHLPVVSGSTGFTTHEVEELIQLAKKHHTSLILAANFSTGINDLINFLMHIKEHYQIQLKEAHHFSKKDAPSGTAKLLASLLDIDTNTIEVTRYNDLTPKHEIILYKQGEKIHITHEVFDRSAYLARIFEALETVTHQYIIQVNGVEMT